jgi:DNA-binding NarL/FixJ family response regulator
MKILLADDQLQVRSALRLLIEQETRAEIVGEAETIEGLLHHSPTPLPEAILLDWELPGLSPSNDLLLIRQTYPSAQIVAMSSQPEARQVALGAGADAFVCKGDPPETLLAVLDDCEGKL